MGCEQNTKVLILQSEPHDLFVIGLEASQFHMKLALTDFWRGILDIRNFMHGKVGC